MAFEVTQENPYVNLCDRGYDVISGLDMAIFLALGEGVDAIIHQSLTSARNEVEVAIMLAEQEKNRWKPEE